MTESRNNFHSVVVVMSLKYKCCLTLVKLTVVLAVVVGTVADSCSAVWYNKPWRRLTAQERRLVKCLLNYCTTGRSMSELVIVYLWSTLVECGSSAVECRLAIKRARFESSLCSISKFGHFFSLHDAPVDSAL